MWASVVSLPLDGLPTLPFWVQDPETQEDVEIKSSLDAINLFNSWGRADSKDAEQRFAFAQLSGVGHLLIDKSFQDVIRRKMYCDRFKIQPFSGAYDDMPEWCMIALNTMDRAEAEATKFVRRK